MQQSKITSIKRFIKRTMRAVKRALIPFKYRNKIGNKHKSISTKLNILKRNINKSGDVKQKNNESFQKSICGTLVVARAFGLFPVQGLKGGKANKLYFKTFSISSFLSLFTEITLIWAAILSTIHTVDSLIKATAGKSGGFANATAGGVFYSNAAVASLLLRSIAKKWPDLISKWEKFEQMAPPAPPTSFLLRFVALLILILALIEHMLSMTVNTPDCRSHISIGNSTLTECLREYCLRSHGFIFHSVPYSVPLGLFIFFVSKVATFVWNFQDLLLIQICLALVAQYRHINKLTMKIDLENSTVKQWKYIRELYSGCCQLAKDVNEILSALVLLSFANNLYFVCLQILNGVAPTLQGIVQNVYFFGSFSFMVCRVICVALAAAAIPLEARKNLPILRSCPSASYCSEIERIIHQLVHDELALSGLGFFTVDRNFMLGVAGAIATYEVVLMQFDDKQEQAATVVD